jgi:hypothetical protein
MRIRITRTPPASSIDGLELDRFEPDREYDVGTSVGNLMLAEGWAIPVPVEAPEAVLPWGDTVTTKPGPTADHPPNLKREVYPPYLDQLPPEVAAHFERRTAPRTQGKTGRSRRKPSS